ncbi:NUDIX domain-containing protein [Herbaspirillum lusitanum]|jgi:8-oxo-dGTP pyrophosphatase MutT (NUDIX family)|uniref:8-oxo-dGTP diphosphatase n=1 Tax=Herbaspirillum lusitanum TaxID=213312 RepID=A0ABW9A6N2_9BURK
MSEHTNQAARRIRIAAALIMRSDGATLLVRKKGTDCFMQAGGKIDAGEQPLQALARELCEELSIQPTLAEFQTLGRHTAPAAHEPEAVVCADLFLLRADQAVAPASEIEECIWLEPGKHIAIAMAPLTQDIVIPLWRHILKQDAEKQ